MGWNQASFFLYAPNWAPVVSGVPEARTHLGASVRAHSAERRPDHDPRRAIQPSALRPWLENQGVAYDAGEDRFVRGRVQVGDFVEQEIDIQLLANDGEVTHLHIRFALSEETPVQCPQWCALIDRICSEWSMTIHSASEGPVGASKFLALLVSTPEWQEFSESLGWDAQPRS